MLAGGREFTGLALSACYRQGQISCLSCHTMHSGDPNDQLIAATSVDSACIKCHQEDKYQSAIATHTHHPANSPGSSCVNCHMPHTTYALLSAIRTHLIAPPDLASSAKQGVPNACNLCHLDKTLAWTADHLATWYGREKPQLTEEQQTVPAGLLWLLKGNAAQRVIAAWHAGWGPAQAAAGNDWLAPAMAPLLADPYGVVRYVAARSLRTLPGFSKLDYDFLAPADEQAKHSRDVLAEWRSRPVPTNPATDPDGDSLNKMLDDGTLKQLMLGRDNRPVTIQE
jgi:predicted CXXCH cytochrome family protein